MNLLREWLEQQYKDLVQEHIDTEIGQYKREGMTYATDIVLKKIAELENGSEDNIDEGCPEKGEIEGESKD